MSRMSDALISCWEAGTVPVEMDEVLSWRAAGHEVLVRFVPVSNWQGRDVPMPAVALTVAERLAGSLDDEHARETLWAAVEDARGYLRMTGLACKVAEAEQRLATGAAATARRLAGEIVAAVAAGEELPEEWHRLDAYAGVGEPVAEEVCRLVRADLEGTGIRP